MNGLSKTLLSTYKPRLAIVAYTPIDGNWHQCYLESHIIDETGRLAEGKPLRQDTIQGIVDTFFDDQKNRSRIGGLIPHNVLYFSPLPGGHYELMWYRPEEERQIFFAESLHIPSGNAWVPALLYRIYRRELYVYALDNNDRPQMNSKLFRAPFHNVYDTGKVCLGSAKVKKPPIWTFEAVMKYWEDLFWLSEFSHLQNVESPTRSNINIIWKMLIAKPSLKWSDIDELKEYKKDRRVVTLQNLIQ